MAQKKPEAKFLSLKDGKSSTPIFAVKIQTDDPVESSILSMSPLDGFIFAISLDQTNLDDGVKILIAENWDSLTSGSLISKTERITDADGPHKISG